MSALLKMSIGEIAAANRFATELFDALGLDYACHGAMTLKEACTEAALDFLEVRRSVEQLPPDATHSWADMALRELTSRLEREQNPRVARLATHLASVLTDRCGPCADHLDELSYIRAQLRDLIAAWCPHYMEEERDLLPMIDHLDDCWTRGAIEHEAPYLEPRAIATTVESHEMIATTARALEQSALRIAIQGPPCLRLQRAVRDLVHAVREHIHVENNILLPRARALSEAVRSASRELALQ